MTQGAKTEVTTNATALYMAIELSKDNWKLAFGIGGKKHRIVNVNARDLEGLGRAIETAKQKFSLAPAVTVRSCYEAGRDGFWIDRVLRANGIQNLVIDPASLEVKRHGRRKKTDRIDAEKMLSCLIRYWEFEQDSDVFSVVHVPTEQEEDDRRLHRELERLKSEKKGHQNRIQSLLFLLGIVMKPNKDFLKQLEEVQRPDQHPIPPQIKGEITREYTRLQLVREQIKDLESQQAKRLTNPQTKAEKVASELLNIKGIGMQGAWILSYELFGWRVFDNRKEVGALVGLTPTPYDSGDSTWEQGISKSGSRRIRSLMVQLSWGWLRFQPGSSISQWYQQHYGGHAKRNRRVGIVAVARRLLVALWKYAVHGEMIAGAC